MLVAGQHEGTMNSFRSDKSLEQGRRKLNGLATNATNDHMANRAPVIVQILSLRDVELEFVVAHLLIAKS